jgi:uncharacterized protein YuzE
MLALKHTFDPRRIRTAAAVCNPARVSLRAGRYTFPYVTYDAPSDVLYASVQPQRSQGRRERTPEQHFLRYDDEGRFVGLTLVEPRSQLEREGAVYVSLPSGDRVRVQGIELELRAADR